MNVILCTVSSTDYNDPVVNGLVHFSLSSHLKDMYPIYAVYRRKENTLTLQRQDHSTETIIPERRENKRYSDLYSCVRQLICTLEAEDHLMAARLSDFGDTSEETSKLYFFALKKGIRLSFFDASYIDSDVLKIGPEPNADQSMLVKRIISNYFTQKNGEPVLSKQELSELAGMSVAKKKSDA